VNATTKDLARIAAAVAREPPSRGSRLDGNEAQRNASHRVLATLHLVTTVGLAITVAVLVFKLSDEHAVRRRVEAKVDAIAAAHPPTIGTEQQQARWALRAALAARMGSTGNGATNVAAMTTAGAPSVSRDRAVQQQLRKQLSDPAMRNAFRAQQRGAMLQLYGELLRSWHMSADKSDRVLDLLAEQQLQQMEQAIDASDPGSARSSQPVSDPKAATTNDELDALLSDAQRKQLQRQQDNLSERLTVGSLADELSLAQMPLTDSQRDQLTQAMVDERKAVPVPDVSSLPANSPDAQRELEDWQSALDQRVQDRAAMILTSAQQARYEQFMTRQREARNALATFEVAQGSDNGSGATLLGATPP
jgi:hypothetical protein